MIEIRNVSNNAINLPYPMRGVLRAGARVVIDAPMEEVLEALGDVLGVLEIRGDGIGEPDEFHKGDLGGIPIEFTQQLTTSLLGRVLAGLNFDQELDCTMVGRVSGGAPSALDPLTILGAHRFYLIGDLGITGEGAGQTLQWADQSGNAVHYTQATDANKPIASAQAAINNRVAFAADGSNDSVSNGSYNLVSDDWIWAVFLQDSWTTNDTLFGAAGTSNRYAIGQAGTTPEMRLVSNTGQTAVNNGAVLGTWTRLRAHCINDLAAYLRLGSVQTTGNPGSGFGSTGRQIFAQNGANFFHGKLAAMGVVAGQPSGANQTALDNWITAYFGSGVAVG